MATRLPGKPRWHMRKPQMQIHTSVIVTGACQTSRNCKPSLITTVRRIPPIHLRLMMCLKAPKSPMKPAKLITAGCGPQPLTPTGPTNPAARGPILALAAQWVTSTRSGPMCMAQALNALTQKLEIPLTIRRGMAHKAMPNAFTISCDSSAMLAKESFHV